MSHNNVSPSILQGAADIQAILNHSRHWAAIRERDRLTVEYEDKLRKAEEQTRAVMHELATTKELEEAHKKQIAIMEELAQVQKQKLVELEEQSKAHKKEVSELSDLNQALKKELVETEERARSQNEKIEAQAKQLADAHAQLASLAPQLDALKSQEPNHRNDVSVGGSPRHGYTHDNAG
ncbi:hypothetical protein K474DRAFT_751610 [Panus rudis PR-1116 ss-1]|nr:hypothetical protein K474DRAFT_751610 [Panus rudis PR-1116 ss-1]